jgi:hypothetical protein
MDSSRTIISSGALNHSNITTIQPSVKLFCLLWEEEETNLTLMTRNKTLRKGENSL